VYHNNFFVVDGERHYYGGVPDVIEIGKHHFMEREVIEMFVNLMLISWYVALFILISRVHH
jgi:CxC5 like cysteine cluster associated with KDZ transposases